VTISKGSNWGTDVARPDDLREAAGDSELARMLSDGTGVPVAVASGDMFTTVGARPLADRTELLALPLDLVSVTVDDGTPHTFVSHLVVRNPARRGGWWRGSVLVVMNAEYIGDSDVAPRGHPNDGRVETLFVTSALTLRQRIAVRHRLRNASHLPHPHIATKPVRNGTWSFDATMDIRADGRRVAAGRQITIEVQPDAATLYA
jgi:hypothetical protein